MCNSQAEQDTDEVYAQITLQPEADVRYLSFNSYYISSFVSECLYLVVAEEIKKGMQLRLALFSGSKTIGTFFFFGLPGFLGNQMVSKERWIQTQKKVFEVTE